MGCAICMNRSRAFCIEFLGKKHPSRPAIYPGKSKFGYELGTPRTQDSSHHQDDITFLGLGIGTGILGGGGEHLRVYDGLDILQLVYMTCFSMDLT